MPLTILYRGPLSSCNYDCHYCPFAKQEETFAELATDRQALQRFADWAISWKADQLSVFFTPWGEALVRNWYRTTIQQLSHTSHVYKIAAQTNLSCKLDWLADCQLSRVGLWCTFHPSQTSLDRFLAQCQTLDALGARYSVGAVGLKEDLPQIQALRQALPQHVYLWINAYKRQADYYTAEEIAQCLQMDPLFHWNLTSHASHGKSCRCGTQVIAVDGEGTIRRCHFIDEPLGNLYTDGLERLKERPCTKQTCGCHIGYVHLDELGLYDVYGKGLLERIPHTAVWSRDGAMSLDVSRKG